MHEVNGEATRTPATRVRHQNSRCSLSLVGLVMGQSMRAIPAAFVKKHASEGAEGRLMFNSHALHESVGVSSPRKVFSCNIFRTILISMIRSDALEFILNAEGGGCIS